MATEVANLSELAPSESPKLRRRKLKEQAKLPSLEEILQSLPQEYFEPNTWKALKSLGKAFCFCVISVVAIMILPWYILPLGWIMLGTTVAGLVTVAQDCRDNAFTKNKFLNFIIGTLCLIPLCLPFESWRNQQVQYFRSNQFLAKSYFWWTTSLWQWITSNFVPSSEWISTKFIFNAFCLYTFIALFFPLMVYNVGLWGLCKYYLIPFVICHFWMSTHLKVEHIFASESSDIHSWFKLQFPSWAEYLSLNLNYTYHKSKISKMIPSYNTKEAYVALQDRWSDCLQEVSLARATLGNFVDEKLAEKKGVVQFLSEVNWPTAIFLFTTPVIGIYGILTTEFYYQTYLVTLFCWSTGCVGITAGYHRLFSHRSFDATGLLRMIVTFMGTQSFEGSVFDWCLDHRAHHRYTDTDLDPYNINRGFMYAHMGWLLKKRDRRRVKADISDLKKDSFLVWQHENYVPLAFFVGIILPMLVCGVCWGDWRGGFFIAGVFARVMIMHSTFCINSIAHTLGELPFNDQRTPRDHFLTSLITFGEGYHNFHHEFPYDYRNGIFWYTYDPTKWVIALAEQFGLATNLKRFSSEMIEKGRLAMMQKRLDEKKKQWDWGTPIEELPEVTWEQLRAAEQEAGVLDSECPEGEDVETVCEQRAKANRYSNFVVVNDIVYDCTEFLDEHPGGRGILQCYLGKDITAAFNGGVYNHSLCARHVLDKLRVAKIKKQ